MAGIKSLAVRGIRSFGPEECDEQRIAFEKPLTLILGQNGCGKTTIIECLRYAITGQMPPGSRNECFVHDAKVNRSSEVLGQVKLKIVNARDKQLEVSRTMKVTAMAKKKTKFQTLDSFLSVLDELGNPKDISSRCADLDFVMHQHLGVSKAILNSVIFCHQEDSSWPLDEGKKVKERFDEIFDSDKYSDCFDRLRKIRKDYTQSLKLLEQEVAFLTENKKDLDKKKLEVVNTETKISEAELKVTELTSELNPVTEKIQAIDKLEKEVASAEAEKEKINARLESYRTQEEELKTSIKNLFEGVLEELQENIKSYEKIVIAKSKELNEASKKIDSTGKEIDRTVKEKQTNEVKFNNYVLLEGQNQERIDNKNKLIVETAQLAELPITEINDDSQADKAIEDIEDKVNNLNHDLEAEKTLAEEEENKLQALVNDSRDALTRHKQKIQSKELEIRDVKKELIKTERQISDANESKVKMEEMEIKLKAAEEEYLEAEKEINTEESQNQINEDEKTMEKHEQELDALNDKVVILQKQNALLTEKNLIEESLKQKENHFSVQMNKHKSALTELLGAVPEKSFAVSVNKKELEIRKEVDALKQKSKEKTIEIAKLETERKHVRETLTERRSELTKAEDQMYRACGTQPYEATLAKVSANVDKLQDEQNVLQSSMFIIQKYKTQLKDNNCCPLCNRGFENETDVPDLISQLTTQVLNVPSKLEKVTQDLKKASAKKDELLSMKSLNEKIVKLKEQDIPSLEKRIADIDAQISTLKEAIEEISTSLAEPEQKLATAKQMQGDMPLLDKYNQEIATTTKKLETVKSKCEPIEFEMTLKEATDKQTELRKEITALRAKIKSAQSKLNAHTKKLQKMAEKKNKQKEQLLHIQKKVQEVANLHENIKQFEANKLRFEEELKELQDTITPLDADVKEKEASKTETVKKNRSEIDVKREFISKIKNSFDKVKAILKEIKKHEDMNIPGKMDQIKESNESLSEKETQLRNDREELIKKKDELKEEFSKQDIYKKDLEDNLKVRNLRTKIEKGESDIAVIVEKMSGIDRETLKEKGTLISKQTQLFRERASTEGELKSLRGRLTEVQKDLRKALAKDTERKYKEKFYELHINKGIDKDIRDYSIALEKCLMEFHTEKMESINMIIREMWRKIYRGNDIDYIEIKCEGSANENSDRRKYDYRVVQCKNGVEIDMRGRCSAGQKVLACLIIRLALAETFSSRFGILALDEPTTNLDEENVRSLCSALGEIVQERMSQKNFMFIIITHDKEFIDSLGNIDKVTHYYEVSRNNDGKSRIKKIRFT